MPSMWLGGTPSERVSPRRRPGHLLRVEYRGGQGGGRSGEPKEVVEPETEVSPKAMALEPTQGQPILSWEALLQAAAKVAGAPSEPEHLRSRRHPVFMYFRFMVTR